MLDIDVSNFDIRSCLYFDYHIQKRINWRVATIKMFWLKWKWNDSGPLFVLRESDSTSAQRNGGKNNSYVSVK
jgi:hypothetical protein